MGANLIVQAQIDSVTKQEASVVLEAMGLTEADAIRIFFTKMAQDKEFPFEPFTPNATTIEAMEDARAGRVTRVKNLDELFQQLNADT